MKRTLALILALMLAVSAIFTTTAFAAGEEIYCETTLEDSSQKDSDSSETNTAPYETGVYTNIDWQYGFEYFEGTREELPLDAETMLQIKTDYIASEKLTGITADDIIAEYYGTMSDGSMLVFIDRADSMYFCVLCFNVIGNYLYTIPDSGPGVSVYKNGEFSSVLDAYMNGTISDGVLDEIAETLKFAKFKPAPSDEEPLVTDSSEATEPDETEPSESTEPDETEPDETEPFETQPTSSDSSETHTAPYETGVYTHIDWQYGFEYFEGTREELPLDAETMLQIKNDYIASKNLTGITADDIKTEYYGTMSDGSMLVFIDRTGVMYAAMLCFNVIGNYLYTIPDSGPGISVYKDGEFSSVLKAYMNGTISDEVLDEIAETLKFAKFKPAPADAEPTEPQPLVTDSTEATEPSEAESSESTEPYETEPSETQPASSDSSETHTAPYETGVYTHIDWQYGFEYFDGTREELPLDAETMRQIKTDYIASKNLTDSTADDIIVEYYGTMSDGSMLVFIDRADSMYSCVECFNVIGNYLYTIPDSGPGISVYKDGEFSSVLDAYINGIITDEVLDEIAETLKFAKFKPAPSDAEPTEPQPIETEPSESTQPSKPIELPESDKGEPDEALPKICGDVNDDVILDISDATYMQMYLAGYTSCFIDESDAVKFARADYNEDGIIDINDVTAIQMNLAKNVK